MEIEKNIEMIENCLYLKEKKILVISDIHLGYEESLNKQGVLIPRFQFKDTMEKLKSILKKVKPKTAVLNGDIKHEFGRISETEWRYIIGLIKLLEEFCKKIVIVKGNHDVMLKPIAKKRNVELVEFYKVKDLIICHGDKIPKNEDFKKSKIVVIGHEHPAISFKHDERVETYKCFLKGKYKNKTVIAVPSFHVLTIGSDIRKEKLLSPFLEDILNFEVFVVGKDEILPFGNLKNL